MLYTGIALHHMLHMYGADYKGYERKLQTDIKPILNQWAEKTNHLKVIWLNQFPTNDFLTRQRDVFSEKIHRYNIILRRVFRYTIFVVRP